MSLRSVSLAAAASAAFVASAASAQSTVRTTVDRYASSAGLGDYAGGTIYASTIGRTSIVRPNGQSAWDFTNGDTAGMFNYGNYGNGAQVDSWMSSNAQGTFTLNGSPLGPNGSWGSTFSINTTPNYIAPTALTFMQLTQQSISLFENIRANGLTGTYTFNTTQTIAQAGYDQANMRIAGQYGVDGVNSGSAFTITISAALSQSATLYIQPVKVFYGWSGTPQFSHPLNFLQGGSTLYGATPVPAPGALALLGLAGLAKRRRR